VSRSDYDRLRTDYEQTLAALQEQIGENDTLKQRVATLEPFEKQTADLTAKARGLEAARAYDKLADDLGIKPEFRDDVYKLAGYEPKGDAIDPKDLKEHFGKFLAERKHYTNADGKEPTKLPKGEGAGRGAKDPGFGEGKPQVTREQLRDPEWTKANSAMLGDPSKYELVMS
jgi:hypothetical protein